MGDANNVFISWSGERSKRAAEALREWLPIVLQAAKPWMSAADIEKGSRGLDEIGRALEGMKVGIICLTPENLIEQWILYEAGALSKTLDAKTRVCTYLLAGLQPQHVKPPLGLFQATKADKDDTRKLIHAINKALDTPVADAKLNTVFDKMWPDLEKELSALPNPEKTIKVTRPPEEMLAEILELARAMVPAIQELKREAADNRRGKQFNDALEQALSGLSSPIGLLSAKVPLGGLLALSTAPSGQPTTTESASPSTKKPLPSRKD